MCVFFFLQYVLPSLVEICCVIPLLALPFVYWVGHSKHWVEYLVLVHIVVVLLLTGLAMAKTGSTEPGRWQLFLRCSLLRIIFVYIIEHTLLRIQVVRHLHFTLFTIHCLL